MSDSGISKMETMPVGRLLITMSIPMMISFFIQALYNIVDSIFVAQISENALTAVSLAFPMQQVLTAIAVGTGVGINTMVPRYLALGKKDEADNIANSGVFAVICFGIIFALLGVFLSGWIYSAQTDITEIIDGGTIYLGICWGIGIGPLFGQYFEKMLIANGNAIFAMVSQAVGAVINIIFDPLFIFGIGPFPKMGIAGAATATVLGQVVAALTALYFNRIKVKNINYSAKKIVKPKISSIVEIYSVGIPAMVTIGLTGLCSFSVNQVLLKYSSTATAVYGIWLKIQNFCFMPSFGMNNGIVPILSYNYAKKNYARIKKTLKYALGIIISLMVILTVIFEFIPARLLTLFDASENMMAIGIPAIRCGVASLIFGGTCIIMGSSMQAMGHSRYTLILNIARQFILPFGMFWILSEMFSSLDIVWMAVPASEIISAVVAIIFALNMMKKLRKICKIQ